MSRPPSFVLDDFLPYRMAVAAERLSVEFSRNYAKAFGLSIPEWRVLVHLMQTGEISVRDIEQRAGLEKSKVSRAVSRLESAGYVTKAVNPGDRRLVRLGLTEKGWALMGQLVPLAIEHQKRLETKLGDDLGPLITTLKRLEEEEF